MKVLVGGALIVLGGCMVVGSAAAGFVAGIAIMNASLEDTEEAQPTEDSPKPTIAEPANGADLPMARIIEINNSTPENPVWVTQEEMAAMSRTHLQFALGAGRLKIVGFHDVPQSDRPLETL